MPVKAPLVTALFASAAFVAPGCTDARPPGDASAGGGTFADTTATAAGAPASRPATRTDTLHIEGSAEPVTVTLFRPPAGFPLPFSTYVPPDMEAEVETATAPQAGEAVRFLAAFGGQRNDDAYVHLFVFPAGTVRRTAVAEARGYTASRGVPVSRGLERLDVTDAARRMPWALESYAFRYQDGGRWYLGSIGVGRHDGRFFQLIRHYPAEFGDGFGPRAGLIIRSWRWADGEPLAGGTPADPSP